MWSYLEIKAERIDTRCDIIHSHEENNMQIYPDYEQSKVKWTYAFPHPTKGDKEL